MINFKKVSFIKSCPELKDRPEESFNELLFVGRSNVGKSSLINALTTSNIAYTSSKPGHTKLLNYFLIDDNFYFVDAPGYGYTRDGSRHMKNFAKMMENYFDNEHLKCVVFIVDSRHIPSVDDVEFYNFLISEKVNYIIALSKCDKLNQKGKAQILKNINSSFLNCDVSRLAYVSIKNNDSLDDLRNRITKAMI
jgi:GTP-binding protein